MLGHDASLERFRLTSPLAFTHKCTRNLSGHDRPPTLPCDQWDLKGGGSVQSLSHFGSSDDGSMGFVVGRVKRHHVHVLAG